MVQPLPADSETTHAVIPDLDPQSTYQWRLQVTMADGKVVHGRDATADTLQTDCAPKKSKACILM